MSPKLKVHQLGDTDVPMVSRVLAFVALFIPGCCLLLWFAYKALGFDAVFAPEQARSQPLAPPGQPHLQAKPMQDLKALERRMDEQLNSTGWVDRNRSLVHIPIDQAMTLLTERGIAAVERTFASEAPGDGQTPNPDITNAESQRAPKKSSRGPTQARPKL